MVMDKPANNSSCPDGLKPDNSDARLELPATSSSATSFYGNNISNSCLDNKLVPSQRDEVAVSEAPVDMLTVERPDGTFMMFSPLKAKKKRDKHLKEDACIKMAESSRSPDGPKPDNSDTVLEFPATSSSEISFQGNNVSNPCHDKKQILAPRDEAPLSVKPVNAQTVETLRPDYTSVMPVIPTKTEKKRHKHLKEEKYRCGWCKYTAVHALTISKHHKKKHPSLELDIVKWRRNSHNSHRKHKVADTLTDSRFEHIDNRTATSRRHTSSRLKYTRMPYVKCPHKNIPPQILPQSVVCHAADQLNFPPVHICCVDILKCDVISLLRTAARFGVMKFCLDKLPQSGFVAMTKRYKRHALFRDGRKCLSKSPKELVNMEFMNDVDIEGLVRA